MRAVTGARTGRLTWASVGSPEATELNHGSRVLVQDGETSWLAEVVVLPEQVLESPPLLNLPVVLRLASDADTWPVTPERAGGALLDSLGLSPELLEPSLLEPSAG